MMKALYLVLALFASQAWADGLPQPGEKLFVHATGGVSLFENTPDPSFGGRPAKVGYIAEGEQVVILEEAKQYVGVLGTELWIHVGQAGKAEKQGWINAGTESEISQRGFSLSHRREEANDEN